jgi:pimeloyl-ACP methyl ester carboxylesterase
MAAFIPVLLDHLGLTRVSLVGISMGGTQALQFALDHPLSVERLVLANTFARLDLSNPRTWPYYLVRLILVHTRGLPAQAQAVARHVFPASGQQPLRFELVRQVLQAQPDVYRSAMRALALFNQQARLGEITAPVLVITGDRDDTVPAYIQRRLVRGLRAAQQVILANAGHAASVERPDEFNRLVLNFLCGQTPREVAR